MNAFSRPSCTGRGLDHTHVGFCSACLRSRGGGSSPPNGPEKPPRKRVGDLRKWTGNREDKYWADDRSLNWPSRYELFLLNIGPLCRPPSTFNLGVINMLAGNESAPLKVLPRGPNFKPNFTAPHRNKGGPVSRALCLSLWTKTPPHALQRTMVPVEPQPRQEWAQTIQKHILKIHFTLPLTFRINRNHCPEIPTISSFPSSPS